MCIRDRSDRVLQILLFEQAELLPVESFVTCFRRCCVQWSLIACVALVGCGGGSGDADVQELRGQLNHERASIRRAAIKKLEKIGPRAAPAVDDLAVFLNDEDPQMRYRAIKALSNIGRHSKRAIDDVSLLLTSDDDQKVRYYAAKTLDQFAKEAGPAVEALTAGLALSLIHISEPTRPY